MSEWVGGWVDSCMGKEGGVDRWVGGWLEGGMDEWMDGWINAWRRSGQIDQRMGESLPFAMAYRIAMLLVFRPLPTLRIGLFLVIISHTTMAKLKISQRSV